MRILRVAVIGIVVLTTGLAAPAAAAPVVLDEKQLEAALLRPSNLPDGGWTVAPPDVIEGEPGTQANGSTGGWCGGATDGYLAGEIDPTAGNARTTLQKVDAPDAPYWFVWETLWSFGGSSGVSPVAQAKSFMSTMQSAAGGCESWTTSGGEIPNSITPEVVPFVAIGDQRFAVQITTDGDGVTAYSDAVYVRVRNNVVVLHTRILPLDLEPHLNLDATLLPQIVKKATKQVKRTAAAAA
jgi:hypothetical protein